MQIATLNAFDVLLEAISAAARIGLVFISPTIWALAWSSLVLPLATAIGSYFLALDVRHRFYISKDYAWQIFTFGKWIFVTAVLYFLSSNFDRLYLGAVVPLSLLGIFGIARTLSGLLGDAFSRVCTLIIFPLVASSSQTPREQLRKQLAPIRLGFLLLIALGVSLFVATSDYLIATLYDYRYQAAGWMLPLLTIGLWFSIMCNINEWTLIGLGRPQYTAVANGLKLGWILIALPLGILQYGILGAVIVITFSDLFRYFPILTGQIRLQVSFAVQDLFSTLIMFALIGFWEWLRLALGLGTSFDHVPVLGAI
jgi:O-antigen/teichoic acid export membrane protein